MNDPKYKEILEDFWFKNEVKRIIYAKEIEQERRSRIWSGIGLCGLGIFSLFAAFMLNFAEHEISFSVTLALGALALIVGFMLVCSVVDYKYVSADPVFKRHENDNYETVYSAMAAHSEEIKKIADDEYRRQHPDPIPEPKDAEEKFVRFVSGKIPSNY